MSRAIFIYCTFFISVAFIATPIGPTWDPIWFSDHFAPQYKNFDLHALHVEDYFYYLFEHLLLIMLFHVIHVDSKSYLSFYRYMFWFQVADAIDYMATYNSVWTYVGTIPVSMNTLGCFIGLVFLAITKFNKS